jgi:hypothetical protein
MQATNAGGDVRVGEWVEGPPEYGWLGLKWVRKTRLPMTAYRCRFETYANAK